MDAWIVWLTIACIMLIAEILTQTLWCISLACVCFIVAIVAFFGGSISFQLIILVIVSLASYFLLMSIFKHQRHLRSQPDEKNARTGMDALIGRTGIVSHEVHPGGLGRVQIDGDNWQVKAPDQTTVIPKGTQVVVEGYDSIILIVKPLN